MRRWLLVLSVIALLSAAISCERTVREPGEPEHGGTFLYGTPSTTSP
ncbi:MAG: hypothetical protein ABSB33_12890 [Tepidisphaeraceae bacterium]|jgi:hypothetical protein